MRRAGVILCSHPEILWGEGDVIIKFLAPSQALAEESPRVDANPQPHSLNFDPANISTESMDLLLEFMTVKGNSFWITPDRKRKKIVVMERHDSVESLIRALQGIKDDRARRRKH